MAPDFEPDFVVPSRRSDAQARANQENAPEVTSPTTQEDVLEARTSANRANSSEAKIRSNRENAKKSTGPKSPQGKRNSSRNAVKHGILAVEVVSEHEDGAPFNRLVNQLCDEYSPEGAREHIQIERIAACLWRLSRALAYERIAVEESHHANLDRTLRYENHVERTLERATIELERLQRARKSRELEGGNASRDEADAPPPEEGASDL